MGGPAGLRMPGITFEMVPPVLTDTLPRMDVASFVGFASAGPLHVPVVVEDVARFREVFGSDAPLARAAGSGETIHAHLGPAVEAFFRGGGLRCWVVRVADPEQARRSAFPLAGLVIGDPDSGLWSLATARARAVGSWADALGVTSHLVGTGLPPLTQLDVAAGRLVLSTDAPVVPGDLLRLTVSNDTLALLTVRDVRRVGAELAVAWGRSWVLRSAWGASGPMTVLRAGVVTPGGEEEVADPPRVEPDDVPGCLLLTFARTPPAVGVLLHLALADGSQVAARVDGAPQVRPSAPSLPGADDRHEVRRVRASAWTVTEGTSGADLVGAGPPVAERLELVLTVWSGEHRSAHIDALGLAPAHPRYWAALPTDEQLYRAGSGPAPGAVDGSDGADGCRAPGTAEAGVGGLWSSAAAPRFPLAGPDASPTTWLPIGLPEIASPAAARGPVTDTAARTRLARDGLATFSAALFVDPDLSDAGAATVVQHAMAKTSLDVPARPLLGIHALVPVDEVTLVAVPDAVHPGWHAVFVPHPPVPAAPHLWPVEPGSGTAALWWTAVAGAGSYVTEQGARSDLAGSTVLLDGPAPLGPSLHGSLPSVGLPLTACGTCPSQLTFRVRARDREGRAGPWSNSVTAVLPPADFTTCAGGLPAPVARLDATAGPGQPACLQWQDRPGLDAEVEDSPDPAFVVDVTRRRADEPGRAGLGAATPADRYHRVRYVGAGHPGPWSNTVVRPGSPEPVMVADSPAPGEISAPLLAVQRALLRLAGGRRDLLAVLTLSAHYREAEVIGHLSALTGTTGPPGAAMLGSAGIGPLDGGEEHVLGHGAVYHPWTVARTATGVRAVPPDGSASGVIARRSLERGAWVSPGNQDIGPVVALTPPFGEDAVGRLLDARVNVLARRPAGFVLLAAHTLTPAADVSPIGVRRLLILLRRLALRHGSTYVFEPHGHRFRAMVRRSFETLLAELYQRGAFVGAVPEEAYRVVGDRSVNPEESVSAGRFVLELQVAPAQPLVFLRVRLVQQGSGVLTVAEV
ncbi:Phage tail sheath protein [Geodermatophilus obscurus]|uniref:Phage tail sheath protein n=1 Tax=Geodermatophilus obscurus TaxID=1861 RepID=A0A1I5HP55_9ACTN|nr:hypothetical protein [Geodermatophilus obscurus]SFO50074.1 Phage tail sheath protein [Geodermatophilus obscurus]